MATFTALALVNRTIARLRAGGALPDLTSNLALTVLEYVNEAKDYVLETRTWDFDKRTDGVLTTVAVADTGTVDVTAGNTAVTTSAANIIPVGDFVTRILFTSDSVYPTTACRVLYSSGMAGVLDSGWVGASNATATFKTVVYEYVLPDTVRDVTSVRFQDDDVRLEFLGRDQGLHDLIPRPTQEIDDDPRIVVVGTHAQRTGSGAPGGTLGLGMVIWPCPLSSYRIDYSYVVRHPLLTATQNLENVSDAASHYIIAMAAALFESMPGRDPILGKANRDLAELGLQKHVAMTEADPHRHRILKSRDDVFTTNEIVIGSQPADPFIFE